ncbi:transposase [Streptomyces flaveolus]|uniref:transposase n=1 Tax=Streptomyces flaveolus TaxID=67297 RepID=UPI0033C80044
MNTCAWIVFLDESGVSLLPQIRRTYSPRGRTPLLRHRLNWKRASMAGALGYHSTDPDRGARLCFHLKPGSYDTAGLIEVLEQMKVFYRGERVVLIWDGANLADVADATEQGIHRINTNPRLPWSFLAHTGLTIHPPPPPNLRKDQ